MIPACATAGARAGAKAIGAILTAGSSGRLSRSTPGGTGDGAGEQADPEHRRRERDLAIRLAGEEPALAPVAQQHRVGGGGERDRGDGAERRRGLEAREGDDAAVGETLAGDHDERLLVL